MTSAEPPESRGGDSSAQTRNSRASPSGSTARRFSWILLTVSLMLCAGAYLWRGIDFFTATAVGCVVVGFNFGWTRMAVGHALRRRDLRSRVMLSYIFKFGSTGLVLYAAIVEFNVDPIGIAVGVSSLVLAAVAIAVL